MENDNEWDKWAECDIQNTKPLDQIMREGDGSQLDLFPEDKEEKEKQKLRQLIRKLYE